MHIYTCIVDKSVNDKTHVKCNITYHRPQKPFDALSSFFVCFNGWSWSDEPESLGSPVQDLWPMLKGLQRGSLPDLGVKENDLRPNAPRGITFVDRFTWNTLAHLYFGTKNAQLVMWDGYLKRKWQVWKWDNPFPSISNPLPIFFLIRVVFYNVETSLVETGARQLLVQGTRCSSSSPQAPSTGNVALS